MRLIILVVVSWCIYRLLRRFAPPPPNLGEELGYIADVNAIKLTINTLIYH